MTGTTPDYSEIVFGTSIAEADKPAALAKAFGGAQDAGAGFREFLKGESKQLARDIIKVTDTSPFALVQRNLESINGEVLTGKPDVPRVKALFGEIEAALEATGETVTAIEGRSIRLSKAFNTMAAAEALGGGVSPETAKLAESSEKTTARIGSMLAANSEQVRTIGVLKAHF